VELTLGKKRATRHFYKKNSRRRRANIEGGGNKFPENCSGAVEVPIASNLEKDKPK